MYQYRIVKEKVDHPDIGRFATYGVAVYKNGTLIHLQHDVSVEPEEVERLVALCNADQVEPIHLEDVIDNIIGVPV